MSISIPPVVAPAPVAPITSPVTVAGVQQYREHQAPPDVSETPVNELRYRVTVEFHKPSDDDFYVEFGDYDLALGFYKILRRNLNSGLIIAAVTLEVAVASAWGAVKVSM